jgi:hypothetical protein
MRGQLRLRPRTTLDARWLGREREAFLELVLCGRRCSSRVCRKIVGADREVKGGDVGGPRLQT